MEVATGDGCGDVCGVSDCSQSVAYTSFSSFLPRCPFGSQSQQNADEDVTIKLIVMGTAAERCSKGVVPLAEALSDGPSEPDVQLCCCTNGAFEDTPLMMSVPSFQLMVYLHQLPVCESHLEALGTSLVYVLDVDPPEGESSVQKQLSRYGYILDELRQSNRSKRASRALLLLRSPKPQRELTDSEGSTGAADGDEESWQSELRDFELVHEGIVKYGPVSADDAIAIGGIFKSIAMAMKSRLLRSSGFDSEGSHFSVPAPLYETERPGDEDGKEEDLQVGPA
mmetsp:Transcript_9499/g.21097  ORF Transcript_9499/g.21097 Transcript_9499/m.21097 type:complete len:282 (+) Transcript_9499:31-876(+)